jgi:hypothetical protein
MKDPKDIEYEIGGMEMPPCEEHPWNDGVDNEDDKF